jgi:hypothetical protein
MNGSDRWNYFKEFWPGIILMTLYYMLLQSYIDFCGSFVVELFAAFGYTETPHIYTTTQVIIGFAVLIPVILFMLIKNPFWNFNAFHLLFIVSQFILLIAIVIYDSGELPGWPFLIISGICVDLSYIPFNGVVFDVMLALFKFKANAQFLMYLVDSCGYTTSIALLFVRNFASPDLSWLEFFVILSYVVAIVGGVLMILSAIYYFYKYKTFKQVQNSEPSTLEKDNPETNSENEENSSQEKDESSSKESESSSVQF